VRVGLVCLLLSVGLLILALGAGADSGPAWSPGGKTIAFDRPLEKRPHGVIAAVSPDGSRFRRLTQTQARHAAWSPDGRTIAYLDNRRDGSGEVWLMNADGSSQRELSRRNASFGPVWSPNGRTIAFTERATDVIYVIESDGSKLRPVTPHHCTYREFA
jgi:TolB protein